MLQRTPKSYEYGVTRIQIILRELRRRDWMIFLQWVPSHCGVEGNDYADNLANRRHCALGQRKLDLGDWHWCHHSNRNVDVAFARMRVGVCKLRFYLYRMRLVDNPICQHCDQGSDETVAHFLLECPSLFQQRVILQRSLAALGIVQLTTDVLLGGSNEDVTTKKEITLEVGRYLLNSGRLNDI